MEQNFKFAIINNPQHDYYSLKGRVTYPENSYGNVMFYPDCGTPYRTCVKATDIKYLE